MSKLKFIFMVVVIFLCSSAFSAERCDVKFEKLSVCANVDWIYGPYLDQYNSAKISITENPEINSLTVIPWMVMRNREHGSRPVVLTKTGDRDYLIEKAFFMGGMEGKWFFRIQLNDSKNAVLEEARYLIVFKN